MGVECCLEGGQCLSQASSCTNGKCSAVVDFEPAVTGGEEKLKNMADYSSNKYECRVLYTIPPATFELKSKPATIACGVDGIGAFAANPEAGITQITGDPEADGWFKVGLSNQLGVYAKESPSTTFEIYATSFVLTEAIVKASGGFNVGNTLASLTLGSFEVDDLLVGFGFKWVGGQTGGDGTMFPKVDPNGRGGFAPATSIALQNGVTGYTGTCGKIFNSAVPYGTRSLIATFQVSCGVPSVNPYGTFNYLKDCTPDPNCAPFATDLPVRGFGQRNDDETTSAFEFFYNENALQDAGIGAAEFENGWKFALTIQGTTKIENDGFTHVVGVPQALACPLPA